MSCQKCNNEAYIHIEGIGDFCIDCYNAWVEETFGENDTYDYPKHLVIKDIAEDKYRSFKIQHVNYINYYIFEAVEEPEGYLLRYVFHPGDSIENVMKVLFNKINDAISAKTLEKDGTLRIKGNISVECSKENKLQFLIDGKRYSMDEFAQMIETYEGQQLQYRIVDEYDSVLKKNELLMPVSVDMDDLYDELNRVIKFCSDRENHISSECEKAFMFFLYQLYDKLKLMKENSDFHDNAIELANKMIERLEELETDNEYSLQRIISKLYVFVKRLNPRLM